jgi:hypothetical protein
VARTNAVAAQRVGWLCSACLICPNVARSVGITRNLGHPQKLSCFIIHFTQPGIFKHDRSKSSRSTCCSTIFALRHVFAYRDSCLPRLHLVRLSLERLLPFISLAPSFRSSSSNYLLSLCLFVIAQSGFIIAPRTMSTAHLVAIHRSRPLSRRRTTLRAGATLCPLLQLLISR